ncbi:hypothetical protein KKF81_05870 [Candidatus Micrarchaeota archaeon]|nr:hypothetical protein [Candidatus Micrarchaeota archaeon]MBU1166457.1 hypothetical protein [Candidatus Micrarchaeota archaeon]
MSKDKLTSAVFIVLGILLIAGSNYAMLSYATPILEALSNFATQNNVYTLQQCGAEIPHELQKLGSDLESLIIPFMYLGVPLIMAILSFLMFLGGFYYHKSRFAPQLEQEKDKERELLRKAVLKMESENK